MLTGFVYAFDLNSSSCLIVFTPITISQSINDISARWITTNAGVFQRPSTMPGKIKPCTKLIRYPKQPIIKNMPRNLGMKEDL